MPLAGYSLGSLLVTHHSLLITLLACHLSLVTRHSSLVTALQVLHAELQARFASPCISFERVGEFDARLRLESLPVELFDASPPHCFKRTMIRARETQFQMTLFHHQRRRIQTRARALS